MTETEIKLHSALLGTGVVQPHQSYSKGGRVEILCRQVPNQGTAVVDMLTTVLKKAGEAGITMHACKRFVIKDGALVFGWNFAIEAKSSKELKAVVAQLVPVLEQVKPNLAPAHVVAKSTPPAPAAPQEPEEEEEPEPVPGPKSEYKTDAQVAKRLGIVVDAKAGKLGRLETPGTQAKYEVGKRLPGTHISVISATIDADGKPLVISEMPLPHVTKEMNVPKFDGDKGATLFGKTKIGRSTQSRRR